MSSSARQGAEEAPRCDSKAAVEASGRRRILLTGASGEIGLPLLDALHEAGHSLHIVSRRVPPDEVVAGPSTWYRADLKDMPSLDAAVQASCPDAVIHMAACTHTVRAKDYLATNVAGTANLLRALTDARLENFVHLSTRAVGIAGGGYAVSKLQAEIMVQASDTPWTILRPAEVYGSGGSDPILSLARSLQRGGVQPVLGDGSYELAPVYVADVIPAIVAAVARRGASATYTLAGPESRSYGDWIREIERILELPPRRRVRVPLWLARLGIGVASRVGVGGFVPDQVSRLLFAKSADSAAARADLGFAPRPLADVLAQLLA